ncbi:MAG: molybdenum cofactor guanylyltransferase [Gammaproteobacteria bacterium]|nr:molybdenum cofactor guanylyltransferase [Gammaproteobacteria bacterium]
MKETEFTCSNSSPKPSQRMTLEQISAVILAGGMARRMNGQDKGLMKFQGLPMVNRISRALEVQCHRVMINANRNIQYYTPLGFDVFSDELTNYQGPLSGMYTALGKLQTNWLITVPCDGPFVDEHYVSKMYEAVEQNKTQLAVASFDGRLQPVYALIHRSLKSSLGAFLQTGERKIDRWYHQHDFSIVDFDDSPEMFININTPEQLLDLETRYHSDVSISASEDSSPQKSPDSEN